MVIEVGMHREMAAFGNLVEAAAQKYGSGIRPSMPEMFSTTWMNGRELKV